MKKSIQDFFSRFRRQKNPDPVAPRTMADSQLEEQERQHPPTKEEKAFTEKTRKDAPTDKHFHA